MVKEKRTTVSLKFENNSNLTIGRKKHVTKVLTADVIVNGNDYKLSLIIIFF